MLGPASSLQLNNMMLVVLLNLYAMGEMMYPLTVWLPEEVLISIRKEKEDCIVRRGSIGIVSQTKVTLVYHSAVAQNAPKFRNWGTSPKFILTKCDTFKLMPIQPFFSWLYLSTKTVSLYFSLSIYVGCIIDKFPQDTVQANHKLPTLWTLTKSEIMFGA